MYLSVRYCKPVLDGSERGAYYIAITGSASLQDTPLLGEFGGTGNYRVLVAFSDLLFLKWLSNSNIIGIEPLVWVRVAPDPRFQPRGALNLALLHPNKTPPCPSAVQSQCSEVCTSLHFKTYFTALQRILQHEVHSTSLEVLHFT